MEKNTSLNTIILLIIKEIRLERGILSGQIAESIGKSPSAWAKIETGKSAFPIESLFQVSKALFVQASAIVAAAERYQALIGQQKWHIGLYALPADEDMLLTAAQEYYNSPGFKRRSQPMALINPFSISVLNTPIYNPNGSATIIDLFRFVLDEQFRQVQLIENALY